jgi:hypothetical protein
LNEICSTGRPTTGKNVQELLIACLTDDAARNKKKSSLMGWMIWIYQTQDGFKNPDRFQHACVHVKYAFKCAAFKKMESFKTAEQDRTFAQKYFKDDGCVFQELEYLKKLARSSYVYVKPEKIRWLADGALQVNTQGSVWISVSIQQLRFMIQAQVEIVERIFEHLGIPIITTEELRTVRDTDSVGVGQGLWSMNKHLRVPVVRVQSDADFLDCDSRIGTALGFVVSYSGGGSMRIPEVNEISYVRLTAGSTRSLRFRDGKLGGRCAIVYDYTKMDLLMGTDAALSVDLTMKFAYEKLSCLLCTHAIRLKPQAISIAMKEHGTRASMIHGAMMVSQSGARMSDDSLRHKFNAIIEEGIPGLSVAPMRHVIEAISFQAVETESFQDICREDMRFTMMSLSAHSARTSDGRYAGTNLQIAGIASHHVEKFHKAARAFNSFIGVEVHESNSNKNTEETKAQAWNWIEQNRSEVAGVALKAVSSAFNDTQPEKVQVSQGEHRSVTQTPPTKHGIIRARSPSPKRQCATQDDANSQQATVIKSKPKPDTTCNSQVHGILCPKEVCPEEATSQRHSSCFTASATQVDTLHRLRSNATSGRFLVVLPCSSGKSYYYQHFARQPNTMLILAQPFVSLVQQSAADAVKLSITTKLGEGVPLKSVAASQGILVLSSFDRLHHLSTLAKQAIAEGLQLVVCIDEVHALLDSVEVNGFRTFQAFWTFMASLESYDVLLFATSATVRPKFESSIAQLVGIQSFHEVIRKSPARPEITLKKIMCCDKVQALKALELENPQLILVMTRSAGSILHQELKKSGKDSKLFHSGLTSAEKQEFSIIQATSPATVIIATTGMNSRG